MRSVRGWLRSHPWLAATLAVAVVALAVVLPAVLRPPGRITRANFQRIQLGMSEAEVLAVLGPPGYESQGSGRVAGPQDFLPDLEQRGEVRLGPDSQVYRLRAWGSPRLTIVVISDAEGRVVCRYALDAQRPDWLARLRSWLP